MSIKNKLNRLKKHMVNPVFDSPVESKRNLEDSIGERIQHADYWEKFGASAYFFEDDYCIVRKVKYPIDTQWGRYRFSDVLNAVSNWQDVDADHPLHAKNLDASDLLFFDTETTGMSGGAGNTIFMLGMSQIKGDHVLVHQFFLPGPGSEVALYHYFLNHVKELRNLVTYNGKSFDWPQVKTRHTLIRDFVPSLPEFGHFDLLHGARRLWKDTLPAVKLSVVEKEMLGVNRIHDTPGYLAPMLYFQYCNEGDPTLLEGVFQHNEWDVLSLITLYTHMSGIVTGNGFRTERETYESARWFEALNQKEHAMALYQEVLQTGTSLTSQSKKSLAALYKKSDGLEVSVRYWLELLDENDLDEEPAIELSKYYEHIQKDYEKALYFAVMAYSRWKEKKRLTKRKEEQEKQALARRIERLEQRVIQYS
ncbi:ribonuclease H-like domain-containing protein [Fictibacillus sp. 18YEL24]|uniref:ribonuclease H-like domain-containing protein n=1 Tax=Fictibacillus sp. 18YEL24 TaxID=2745875 RepID=UPI0018CD7F4E|nr:ribonuclease H-like domain-containing protein [Fictibacillus sp. 18YEL24]MBH0168055.1 ribonuclease H-like domain-containing protein [Fictibacillus sp. 18YEL24]